ncbi:MAG: RNA-guided endonuclease InsQ/TnpB family protein [Promethearchaeota archaeon]
MFPSQDQEKLLWLLSEKCRLLYNFALHDRIENWKQNRELPEENRKYITYLNQQNQLPALKKQYPEYKWVYSKVLQGVLKKLDANYKSFFALWKRGDMKTRPPKFKGKKYFHTLTYNQSGFKHMGNTISFSHKHMSTTPLEFQLNYIIPIDSTIKQVELFVDSKERWFTSISYEVIEKEYVDNGKYQAIDLGISNLVSAVNLDSKFIQIKNKRADLFWKDKLAEVQSRRDHCKKYSTKWKRYNSKLYSMKRKCTYQLKDFQHKISKQVIENTKANTIIVGDLKITTMAKKKLPSKSPRQTKANKTLNHSMQNTGSMGRFVQFLTYKAQRIGKRVMKIDESYTTQVCCRCGMKKKRSLSERDIFCNCGNRIDRDLNSAINIMKKYLYLKQSESLLHQPSVNEESFLHKWNGFTMIHSLFRTKSKDGLMRNLLL